LYSNDLGLLTAGAPFSDPFHRPPVDTPALPRVWRSLYRRSVLSSVLLVLLPIENVVLNPPNPSGSTLLSKTAVSVLVGG